MSYSWRQAGKDVSVSRAAAKATAEAKRLKQRRDHHAKLSAVRIEHETIKREIITPTTGLTSFLTAHGDSIPEVIHWAYIKVSIRLPQQSTILSMESILSTL